MDTILVIASIVILLVAVFLFLKKPGMAEADAVDLKQLKQENEELKIKLAKTEERANNFNIDREKLSAELSHEREKLAKANQELEKSLAWLQAQKEKIDGQAADLERNQEKFTKDFELIANKILEEKSKKFTEVNRSNLDILLTPLKDNIKAFEEKVDKVYKVEADERNTLKGVITQLMDLNKMMSAETQNLTRALKGENKKQGNWGEVILEKVLERSGLVRDREYRIQVSLQTADGSRLQPDVVIDLPGNKHLVIDAKVSLIAYERLVNCEDENDRELFTKQHLISIRNHVSDLSSKNYTALYQIDSPDFVLLFVPIESCFSLAVQKDAELFNFAWNKRIVIVSPSTLLATLRTIASMWNQERQNRNVMEISRLSGEMYDKFVGFITDMESIGKNMKQSQDAYDRALNKLSDGRGNLTATAEKIKTLGARTSKSLDKKFLDES